MQPFRIAAIALGFVAAMVAAAFVWGPRRQPDQESSSPRFPLLDMRDALLRVHYLDYLQTSKWLWSRSLPYSCADGSAAETYRAAILFDFAAVAVEVQVSGAIGTSLMYSKTMDEADAAKNGRALPPVSRPLDSVQVAAIRESIRTLASHGTAPYAGMVASPNTPYFLEACVDGHYGYYQHDNPHLTGSSPIAEVVDQILATSGESVHRAVERDPVLSSRR